MFEAHPLLTLLGVVFIVVMFCATLDLSEGLFGVLIGLAFFIWLGWVITIPSSPEEIAAAEAVKVAREARLKEKEIPRIMSEADGCTVYVFERQGREHFFTRCLATTATETTWTEGCGKTCSRQMSDTITTPNK